MGKFLYNARDSHGKAATGIVTALSVDEASQMLRSEGKFIVNLSQVNDADFSTDAITVADRAKRVKRDSVIHFAQQLAIMIETGVPISDALDCVTQQSTDPNFKAVLGDITKHVQAGGELSAALRKYPKVFPVAMTSLIRASEVSGTMGAMLNRIATYLAKEQHVTKRVRGALAYPLFMLAIAIGVTVFLLAFVLPRFAAIYATRGASLPAPTRLLIMVSGALVDYWYLWVALIAAAAFGLITMNRTVNGQRFASWLKLKTPVLRHLFLALYVGRVTRTMGVMLTAGVSMLETIPIAKQVVNNSYFDDLFDDIDDRLRQGSQLSDPLFASKVFPRPVAQMIYSGEKSGRLSQVMLRVADHAEGELDDAIKTATQFIEPVIIVFMGALVGFVAISLLLPIFNVSTVMSQG
jgi:type IV pilus assembly protein PilC